MIRAVDGTPGIPQAGKRALCRVAITVACAHGDHRILGQRLAQKHIAGGRAAAVVTHRQHITTYICTALDQAALLLCPGVTHKEKSRAAKAHLQHQTAVVQIAAGSDLNNSSLVLQVRFSGATFLFMGDAGAEEERSLIQSGADVSCDVLAVGHHGSGSATGYVFLRQALPKYAVISVGAGNRYGHPAESTLSRLRDAGCTVYRTDQSGTITIVTDKNGKIRCPA